MNYSKERSRESRAAIERLYVTMRHLFMRGGYKPMGVSGKTLIEALHILRPEIYGDLSDSGRVELEGLLYVAERLPRGIEECRFVQMVAREGFSEAGHEEIIPLKRRRNCYRIDTDRMYVEMSRGRSDIYDILTHLTFLYVEAEKIKRHALDHKRRLSSNWERLEKIVEMQERDEDYSEKQALAYLSNVLGRTIQETRVAAEKFENSPGCNNLYHFTYWLGQVAINEDLYGARKEIIVSEKLQDVLGHHIYGEKWAHTIKSFLAEREWLSRPVHIISANMHSVLNSLYGLNALEEHNFNDLHQLATATAKDSSGKLNLQIRKYALENGLYEITDHAGTHLKVQIINLEEVNLKHTPISSAKAGNSPIIIVMDYAFGEQAYECMDELLKPFEDEGISQTMNVESISIMGKAGILEGKKGDLMIPTAHVFEGTADNYPFTNELAKSDFEGNGLDVYHGPMITVLGTSLQNRDVLYHFQTSTWNAIGLEMEGAHYQKAIQSAAKIRKSIRSDVKVQYAYYASDNPLITGSTLSSGSLGEEGIKPTYLITQKILEKILS